MELSARTAPKKTIVSLAEAKRHLGVADNTHDIDIERMIRAATEVLTRSTGRAFLTTEYRLRLAGFCAIGGFASFPIELPFPPLISIDSITYYDSAGDQQTFSDYQLENDGDMPARLFPARDSGLQWPVVQSDRVDAVTIDYTAGYGDSDDAVPPTAQQWVLLAIRHWYDNPAAVITGTISKEVEFSLRSLRASLGIGYYANV